MTCRPMLRLPRAVVAAVAASLAIATLVAAQNNDLSTPSPARGGGQVIAQGMSAPAAERMVWRAVERTVPVRRDARPSDRMPDGAGFLLADGEALFVTDQDTKLRVRLAPGEASFVPAGSNQTWASVTDEEATGVSIELVTRDAYREVGSDELVGNSRSFRMPGGDYDLDLVRDTLDLNERSQIETGEFPALIMATSGQIEVRASEPETTRVQLAAGEVGAFSGSVLVRGRDDGASTFVAGVVGPSIGGGAVAATSPTPAEEPEDEPEEETPESEPTREPEPTEEPTPEPEPEPTDVPAGGGSLTLDVRVCPQTIQPTNLNGDLCTGIDAGYDLSLVGPDGSTRSLAEATRLSPVTIQWGGLAEGPHVLLITVVPAGYVLAALDGYVCCTPSGGFDLTVGEDAQLVGTLYFFLPPAG